MRHLFLVLSLVTLQASAQSIEGDWRGTLKAPGGDLRLVFHINRSDKGELRGSVDSLDQSATIPATKVSQPDPKSVTLEFSSVAGEYTGTIDTTGSKLTGTWTQGGASIPLSLDADKPVVRPALDPTKIVGTWEGTLNPGPIKLRLALDITRTESGTLAANLRSIDQGDQPMPVDSIKLSGRTLSFELLKLKLKYEGTARESDTEFEGIFTQGAQMPLSLKKVEKKTELRRPQVPAKPYPYNEEDVSFPSTSEGVKLAGTLTLPKGAGPFPAVVLVSGSGPQDRDESLMGHKPFLILSDYLTRKGIAVLRYDDRGFGKSTGDFASATSPDLANDAEGGVKYLKTRKEVNPAKIGIIGHSEGGMIAPMVAARNRDVAFIVLMAGIGMFGKDLLLEQQALITKAMGMPAASIERVRDINGKIYAIVIGEKDVKTIEEKVRPLLAQVPGVNTNDENSVKTYMRTLTAPWFRYFLAYDPAPALSSVKVPVLAVNGELDLQVPATQNLARIRKTLEAAGNKDVETASFPNLNHLFQTASTGAPSEYGTIEETMNPAVLDKISSWVLKRTT